MLRRAHFVGDLGESNMASERIANATEDDSDDRWVDYGPWFPGPGLNEYRSDRHYLWTRHLHLNPDEKWIKEEP